MVEVVLTEVVVVVGGSAQRSHTKSQSPGHDSWVSPGEAHGSQMPLPQTEACCWQVAPQLAVSVAQSCGQLHRVSSASHSPSPQTGGWQMPWQ